MPTSSVVIGVVVVVVDLVLSLRLSGLLPLIFGKMTFSSCSADVFRLGVVGGIPTDDNEEDSDDGDDGVNSFVGGRLGG